MSEKAKKALIVNDLSCAGRISLMVIVPVLCAMGVETYPIPTALLSTHTGYDAAYYHDLTGAMLPIAQHWQKLNLKFDAIYCGFLGSVKQIDIVSRIIDIFKVKDTFLMIDPCMADNGKLYRTYSDEMVCGVKKLCSGADLIVPNLTEAYFLSGREYHSAPYELYEIQNMLKSLSELGAKSALITGVKSEKDKLLSILYDSSKKNYNIQYSKWLNADFFGSGDMFASVVLGGILNNISMEESMELAVKFMTRVINLSIGSEYIQFPILKFESELGFLANEVKKKKPIGKPQ